MFSVFPRTDVNFLYLFPNLNEYGWQISPLFGTYRSGMEQEFWCKQIGVDKYICLCVDNNSVDIVNIQN